MFTSNRNVLQSKAVAQRLSNGWLRERTEEVASLMRLFSPEPRREAKDWKQIQATAKGEEEVVKNKNNELWE